MDAYCQICGKQWDARDPGITYWYGTGTWECTEEGPCFDRRLMAVMEALDSARERQ